MEQELLKEILKQIKIQNILIQKSIEVTIQSNQKYYNNTDNIGMQKQIEKFKKTNKFIEIQFKQQSETRIYCNQIY